jgi:hypothetical protein
MGNMELAGAFFVQERAQPAGIFRFAYQQDTNRTTIDRHRLASRFPFCVRKR